MDEEAGKMEEKGFVKLLHEGDEVCFKGIYERYFAALSLYAQGIVESEPVSADIVQDAFVALLIFVISRFIAVSLIVINFSSKGAKSGFT